MFVLIGVLVLGRATPIQVDNVEVLTPEVEPGGTFTLKRSLSFLRRDCTKATMNAELVDSLKPVGFHHVMAPQDVPLVPGPINRSWQIPFAMPWGPATFQATIAFDCFPFYGLWPIEVSVKPVMFNVIEPTANPPQQQQAPKQMKQAPVPQEP